MGCSLLRRPVETHRMVFRACPACSELEPSLILGAGGRSEKAGRGKKECVPGTASVGLSALSCLGIGGRRLGTAGHKVLPVPQGPSQPPGCAVAG